MKRVRIGQIITIKSGNPTYNGRIAKIVARTPNKDVIWAAVKNLNNDNYSYRLMLSISKQIK